MGRVCPLLAAGFDEPARSAFLEQLLQQEAFSLAREEARPKLAEHGEVKARIGQLEPQQILPIHPRTDRFGGWPVGKVLAKLQDRDEG